MEGLRDFLDRELEESEVEDVLLQLNGIIPFVDLVAAYLEWRERFNFKRLSEARSALTSFLANSPEKKTRSVYSVLKC